MTEKQRRDKSCKLARWNRHAPSRAAHMAAFLDSRGEIWSRAARQTRSPTYSDESCARIEIFGGNCRGRRENTARLSAGRLQTLMASGNRHGAMAPMAGMRAMV
jgi:hypothetical protein